MREILFRGKRKNNGEWIYGDLVHCTERQICIATEKGEFVHVIPETVGQYTGVVDKTGRRVFEGDITEDRDRHDYNKVTLYEIGFDDGSFGTRNIPKEKYFTAFDDSKYGESPEWHYVIGNIHDNPELLEVKV